MILRVEGEDGRGRDTVMILRVRERMGEGGIQ